MKKYGLGVEGEDFATKYLTEQGYEILDRNFASRFGEVDVVARKENYLCFIEVKTRKSAKNIASGFEAVSPSKQKKIIKTAEYYLVTHKALDGLQPRFDCLEINVGETTEIKMLTNAFSL